MAKNKKEKKEEIQIQSLYNEELADISMPDMLLPPPPEEKEETIVEDAVQGGFKFCFIGIGQGGSRIAKSFYDLGYRRVVALNTAQQDLNTINLKDEMKFCFGDGGGAGKDPGAAAEKFKKSKDDILDFLRYSFGERFDRIMICAGAGGGTGSGSATELVKTCHELIETLGLKEKNVGLILALPKKSEGKRVNKIAQQTLSEVFQWTMEKRIAPLILIDNEKVGELYPNLSVSGFWEAANKSLTGLFHLFNLTCSKDSSYSTFDANDYKTVLDSGLLIYGASPVADWEDPVAISRTVRENLVNNLLTGDVSVDSATHAGVIVVGGTHELNTIKQSSLDSAFDQLSRLMANGSTIHRGIYSGDKPGVTIFTTVGGIKNISQKIKQLADASR